MFDNSIEILENSEVMTSILTSTLTSTTRKLSGNTKYMLDKNIDFIGIFGNRKDIVDGYLITQNLTLATVCGFKSHLLHEKIDSDEKSSGSIFLCRGVP